MALLLCALCALVGRVGSSLAGKPHCRLELLDLSSFEKSGLIKVVGGSVELEGKVNTSIPARDFRLQVNGKTVLRAEKLEPFERTGQELYIALLVEISALYAPAIEKIKDTLKEFLESLPQRTKVKLILFGYDIEQQPTFMPAPAVSPLIDDINPDDQGDVQLLNAINAGLAALNKVQPSKDKSGRPLPSPRKVVVVLSDGLNQLMDRKSFKRVGELLKHSEVPLFPIAFSIRDDRGPLLNLGELAKRSGGTFRWAQGEDSLKPQFENLAEELRLVHVISFPGKKFDLDELQTASFVLGCSEMKSGTFAFPGSPPPKHSTWWKWVLGILGGLVGLWLLAQGAVLLLARRGRLPGQPVGARPPGPPATGQPARVGAGTSGYPPAGMAYGTLPLPQAGGRVYTATLIGIGAGQLGGQRFKVEASFRIGKAVSGPFSLLVGDDPSLAGSHCELRRDGAGFAIFDLSSSTGVFINDRRISGQARLQDGDIIRLGENTQLRFRLDD